MTSPADPERAPAPRPAADPSSTVTSRSATPISAVGGDWPAQAADSIVQVVGTVRDKTTGPALTVARAVVYGLLILIVAVLALVLFVIGTIRVLDIVLPIWGAYLLLGTIFVLAGWVLYRQRAPRTALDPGNSGPGRSR